MRITNQMAVNTVIDNILDNYARLLKIQNQMATGRRVLAPSDDPLATNEGIRLQTMLSQIDQYLRSIDTGESFLGIADGALQNVNDIEQDAKSLTIGMAQDTNTPAMRQGMVLEVENILQELVTIANRRIGNRYLFGGTHTTEAPFTIVGSKYVCFTGNDEAITVQVDRDTYAAINTRPTDVFGALVTTQTSAAFRPEVNLDVDTGTRLADLNDGSGVSAGSIRVRHTVVRSNPPLVTEEIFTDVDLRGADTLEDAADLIAEATGLTVTVNPTRTGLLIRQNNALLAGTEIEVSEIANNTTAQDLGLLGTNAAVTLVETADRPGNLSNYALTGVDAADCGSNGELYFSVTDLGGGSYRVDVYSDAALTTLVATGTGAEGTITLNDGGSGSGIAGTVDLDYASDGISYVTAVFDAIVGGDLNPWITGQTLLADLPGYYGTPLTLTTGSDDLQNIVVAENRDTNNTLDNYQLSGASLETNTDAAGRIYWSVTDLGGTYRVEAFRDSSRHAADRVAVGTSTSATGTVALAEDNASGLSGTVDLRYLADDDDIQVTVEFPEAFQSTLQVEAFEEANDEYGQATGWQLFGLKRGLDTNDDGEIFVEVVDNAGVRTVNLYSDAVGGDLVASGVLPAGTDNGLVELIGQGTHDQVGGTVNLEYLADDNDITLTATFATVRDFLNAVNASGTYTVARVNATGRRIEISSRLAGATLHVVETHPCLEVTDEDGQLTRWNLGVIQAGVNSGRNGELYAAFTQTPGATNVYTVNLYSDAARTNLVATGSADEPAVFPPVAPNELVITITEAAGTGSGINGSVNVRLYTGDDLDIVLAPQGLGLSGKRRADNIFSTLNDVIEAGLANDAETLHNLIGNFETDLNRVLSGRAEIGARADRFSMLRSRLQDEQTSFGTILSERIDLDYADAAVQFQAKTNIYNAALAVAGRIIPMSLVDFL
ncbi:MAG: flagellar hook-associated protein FlgL [Planctomycetota bacterium]